MLGGKNFRGRHEGDLVAVFNHDGGGFERDDCFAAADIAFEEAVHGIGALKICGDFDEDAFLGGGWLEWKDALHGAADLFLADAHGDAFLSVIARTAESEGELVVEKLFEDQTRLRGAAKTVQQLDAFILGREVRVEQGIAPRWKAITFTDFGGERVRNISVEIV